MMEYLNQSPIVSIVFSVFLVFIVVFQSITKKKVILPKLIFSLILTFCSFLVLFFYQDVIKSENNTYIIIMDIGMLLIEALVLIILFLSIDVSFSNQTFQRELTKSLDETKLYVLLDRKDRIKEISQAFCNDLGVKKTDCYSRNFFDVIEVKYRIIGLNGEGCLKKDVKTFYERYEKRVKEGDRKQVELDIEDDNASKSALYFNESVIFANSKYRGRILIGDIKDEESLVGLEKREFQAINDLKLVKERFVTILDKTSDGIFFNTISKNSIWANDILVKKLMLNGNSTSSEEYYNRIHPDDKELYKETLTNVKDSNYSITYRFNRGSQYVYVKEEGHRIRYDDSIELCGIVSVYDDFSYEKTNTSLDNVRSEEELVKDINELYREDKTFELVHLKLVSIPDLNEKFGRAIGNLCMSQYLDKFRDEFVYGNMLYRTSGLEFVGIITEYNKMETLKAKLRDENKLLHLSFSYGKEKGQIDVNMGIAMSSEAQNADDIIRVTRQALKYSLNENYISSYCYYKDIR